MDGMNDVFSCPRAQGEVAFLVKCMVLHKDEVEDGAAFHDKGQGGYVEHVIDHIRSQLYE